MKGGSGFAVGQVIGKRFGRVRVIASKHKASRDFLFVCQCDCGQEFTEHIFNLRAGRVTSCRWCTAGQQSPAARKRAASRMPAETSNELRAETLPAEFWDPIETQKFGARQERK